MNWKKAVKYMRDGGRITRKSWLKDYYLYIEDGVLFCDGGFEYLEYLPCTRGEWIKHYTSNINQNN